MKVQVINKSQWELPKYETLFSAGMDVRGDFSRIKLVDGKPEKFFFDAVYDNNKELVKAFYSEVGDCTADNIIKYLNEVQ
jgi:hypothetical protein